MGSDMPFFLFVAEQCFQVAQKSLAGKHYVNSVVHGLNRGN